MKTLNQAKKALFAMLAVASILPGCGKKNDGAVVGTAAVGAPGAVSAIGTGQCASISGNAAQTLTFSGTLNSYSTGLVAQLPTYGYGAYNPGWGSTYWRTNTSGDRIDVYVSGSSAFAVVSLSALTVQAITGYSGYTYGGYQYNNTAQICGLDINATISAGAGAYGTMSGTIYMWSNGGYVRNIASGQPILL